MTYNSKGFPQLQFCYSKGLKINITSEAVTRHTCVFHMLNAHLDKLRHRRVLLLAQGTKAATKHLVCGAPITSTLVYNATCW